MIIMASSTTTRKSRAPARCMTGSSACKSTLVTIIAIMVCIQIVFILEGASTQAGALYITGKTERSANEVHQQLCDEVMPCGWEVYKDLTKQVRTSSYFVYSPCRCGQNFKCVRDTDDVSINSYVHRCKPTATTSGTSEDNNLKK